MSPEPAPPLPVQMSPVARPRALLLRRALRLAIVLALVLAVGSFGAKRYRETRPEYRFARGQEAVAAGQWDRAEGYADALAADRPEHAALIRAEVLLRTGRPADALALLNTVRTAELRSDAAVFSARCYRALGNLPEARRLYTFVLSENADHADAHRGLAAIAYDLGQLDRAADHLERVAGLDPRDGRPHRLLGLIYKDLAQLEPAETAYREALRRSLPDDTRREVRLELGETLARLTRYADALEVLTGEAPHDAAWVAVRVECLRALNRRTEATTQLDAGLRDFSTAAPLWRLRGQLALDGTHTDEAIKALEQAVTLAPADEQARYLLGQAYTAAGRPADADREFQRRDEIRADLTRITDLTKEAMDKPWDPAVRLRLAEVCDRLEKPDLAKMWRTAAAVCQSTVVVGAGK